MRTLHYCEGWFRAKKRPLAALTPAQAQARHEQGALYCVLLDSAERPTAFLEVVRGSVGVGFLDDRLREVLSYGFQMPAPGRLFLGMATWRTFDGDTDRVRQGTTHVFGVDGSLKVRRETLLPSYLLETAEQSVDVSGHWEAAPAFGDYAALTRAERG